MQLLKLVWIAVFNRKLLKQFYITFYAYKLFFFKITNGKHYLNYYNKAAFISKDKHNSWKWINQIKVLICSC